MVMEEFSIIEVNIETDFAAKMKILNTLRYSYADCCKQSKFVSIEDVPAEVVEKERGILRAQL